MQLIRYCDDFVLAFESRKDAGQFLAELHARLAKFGLEVAPEKTRLLEFGKRSWKRHQKAGAKGETFSFLGFTHYMTASRAGFCIPGHKTSKQNLRRKLRDMKEWLKKVRASAPLSKWRSTLNSKLIGHCNYFGVSGNMRCLQQFFNQTKQMMFKWLNRRSQKKNFNWAEFGDYLERNPLHQPRIRHRLYGLKQVS